MKIGNLELIDTTVLAPLAGITNLPFRMMVKAAGCGLVCSEMVSANGLVHNSWKTKKLMESNIKEKPLSLQLFGADPAILSEAATMAVDTGADVVDINFGCSVKKILKSGAGAALMKTPEKTAEILKALRKVVTIPLTIKIRTGWEPSGNQAILIAKIAEDCGVDAITVHPRTATQGFRGHANWAIIKAVKENVGIPVIGNGDIVQAQDALDLYRSTGCDGVMIGRAAISNPWIFNQVSAKLQGEPLPAVSLDMRFDAMVEYVRSSVAYFGEQHACCMMRSRLGWVVKGLKYSSQFRKEITRLSTEAEAIALIRTYINSLKAGEMKERGL